MLHIPFGACRSHLVSSDIHWPSLYCFKAMCAVVRVFLKANPQRVLGTESDLRDWPGGQAVRASPSSAGAAGSVPSRGAETPHVSRPKTQGIKQKQYRNKFNKAFKNGPHLKKQKLSKMWF